MEFRILGPLEVADGGRLLDLGGPRQRALVAALLIHANRVVSADRLIDILWGERAPGRAAAGLHVLVSNLRRVLEPERRARSEAQVLVTRPPGYSLVTGPTGLDATRFESLLEAGQEHLAAGRPAAARAVLDNALGLWRGPALAEFAFEDFARSEANRLEELRRVALEDRVQADLDLGRHAAVVADLERLVGDHPLRERLWGLLMIGYYRSGRQADALRAFQQARRHLGDELGIDPSPALQRLESDVLAQAESLDWHPPAEERAGTVEERPPPRPRAQPARPLIGRTEELDRMTAALEEAKAGHGRLVVLAGEPGVGKTRLVEAVVDQARDGGALVCWGRCHPGDGAPPFWPWAQVVRELAAVIPPEGAPSPESAAVAQLVPELRDAAAAAAVGIASADPAAARFHLCQDLTAYILRAAGSRCVVVALDDLHWADPPSLELLMTLAARFEPARVLVLGTYRDVDTADEDHPWARAMAVLARLPSIERLALRGMSEEEAAQLIAATTGNEPSAALAHAVHARTDGNPFFMSELLRLLTSEGQLEDDPDAAFQTPVPLGVRDVITQRVAQLTPEAKTLLTVAAVAGREFDQDLLDRAGDLGGDEALAAVELALSRGILTEIQGAIGRYRFTHALIRETVYAGISAVRRARLHARVASALEALPGAGPDRVVELAHHFWQAGPVAGPEKAFEYALAAAEAASGRLAYEQAEVQLRRALDLVASLPSDARPAAELRVLARLGTHLAATRGQAAPEVEEAFSRAADLCRELEGNRDAITALWGFFYSSYVRGELAAARNVAGKLATTAGDKSRSELALAGNLALGVASFHEGELEQALAHLSESTRLADELADPSLAAVFQVDPRVYARCFTSLVLALLGDAAGAGTVASAAQQQADALALPFSMATAAMFGAWLGFLGDDPDAVRHHAARTKAVADEHRFPLLAALSAAFGGWAIARGGDPAAGSAQVARGLAPFGADGAARPPLLVALEAEVSHLAGRSDEALARIDEALSVRATVDHHYFSAALHRLRAEILLAAHPHSSGEAEASLRRAITIAASQKARLLEERAAAVAEAVLSRS